MDPDQDFSDFLKITKPRSNIRNVKLVYDKQKLLSLNRKDIFPINPELVKFFSKFPKTKIGSPYANRNNRNFPSQSRKKIGPKIEPFSDDKIIAELRSFLGKLSEANQDTIIEQISKLHFTASCEDRVAETIFQVTLDCIFLARIYVDLIINLEEKIPSIVEKLHNGIIQQVYHPRVFSSENDEIASETSVQKAKRWRINNGLLIAEMFNRDKFPHQFIVNKIVVPLINGITQEDTINIEILNKILPIIGQKLELIHNIDLSGTFYTLHKFSKNKEIPARLRFLLLDTIELRENNWVKQ